MIEKLAFYQNRNDEEPNIQLAEELVEKQDKEGVAEIVNGLSREDRIASDCIKVLYEIGYRAPHLISEYAPAFVKNLRSKNNRMVWGASIALSLIAEFSWEYLFQNFDVIYHAYEKGSVITRDNCISIFAGIIRGNSSCTDKIFPVIINHLKKCKPKEVAQHAERAFLCVTKATAQSFQAVLQERYHSLTDSQKKRLDKIIRKIEKNEFA